MKTVMIFVVMVLVIGAGVLGFINHEDPVMEYNNKIVETSRDIHISMIIHRIKIAAVENCNSSDHNLMARTILLSNEFEENVLRPKAEELCILLDEANIDEWQALMFTTETMLEIKVELLVRIKNMAFI